MKKIRIVIEGGGTEEPGPHGITIGRCAQMTRVYIDGEEVPHVRSVEFKASADDAVMVTMAWFPDVVEVETE